MGLLPLLVSHLSSRSRQVVYPAIRTLGTIVSGTDSQVRVVGGEGGMLVLVVVGMGNKDNIRRYEKGIETEGKR